MMLILISELRMQNTKKRDDVEASIFQHLIAGHKVKKYTKFLKSPYNREMFIAFLAKQWFNQDQCSKMGSKVLYITDDEIYQKNSSNLFEQTLDLQSDHEEADTHYFLNAKHGTNEGVTSVLNICEDTDVMVLPLSNAADIDSQIFMRGEPIITPEAYILMKSESL